MKLVGKTIDLITHMGISIMLKSQGR